MWKITRAGLRTQLVEYVNLKESANCYCKAPFEQFKRYKWTIYWRFYQPSTQGVLLYSLCACICFIYDYVAPSIPVPRLYTTATGPHKIETDETWSVFNLSNQNRAVCSSKLNVPYESTNWLYGSIHWVSQKERLCFKIMLGQAWYELYCASYYSPCDHSIVVRIGLACSP